MRTERSELRAQRRSEGERLLHVIEAATNSTEREPDTIRLKAIKALVRYSEDNTHAAARLLLEKFHKRHSQVRLMALFIVDELFTRSKLFRVLWIEDLDKFLTLSVGFRKEHPLPPPQDRASLLRSKTLECLQSWTLKFGHHYKKLRLGYRYLKDIIRLPFPFPESGSLNDPNQVSEAERIRRERAARTQQILLSKFEVLVQDFDNLKDEIRSTVDQIRECFEILSKERESGETDNTFVGQNDEFCYEYGSSTSMLFRQIREATLLEARKPVESKENKAVFDAMRDLYRLLSTRHLSTVQDRLSVLMKVELPEGDRRRQANTLMKELIDLRNELHTMKRECEGLGCNSAPTNRTENDADEDDEIIWEEDVHEPSQTEAALRAISCFRDETNNSQSDDTVTENNRGECSKAVALGPLKQSLLQEAPVLQSGPNRECKKTVSLDPLKQGLLQEAPLFQWGPDLDTWGAESTAPTPANQRGLDIENHWGRVDLDAVLPSERAAELNLRATIYKDEKPEIRPCNARLKDGKLCPRRDLRVCPFHGPKIPRDSNGNPLVLSVPNMEEKGKSSLADSQSHDEDSIASSLKEVTSSEEAVRLIASKAAANVRSRNEEEKKRKEADQLSAKRAKLRKVREHNEAVLRASGIASSRQGLGEAIAQDLEGWAKVASDSSKTKETLSSMLKKKPTSKDRLSQKLLNARVSDATVRQLTKDDDRKYTESFVNQW